MGAGARSAIAVSPFDRWSGQRRSFVAAGLGSSIELGARLNKPRAMLGRSAERIGRYIVRLSELPRVGKIENPMDGDLFGQWADLAGKDVLCIGFSEEQVDGFISPHQPNSVHLLTYWADHKDSTAERYPLHVGDITKGTAFEDNQFDLTLTMSVLEHVSDVPSGLAEMHRISREATLHIFGPAWSCAYGHHLCTGETDPLFNFYTWQMPAHMHLLGTKDEVCSFYAEHGLEWHMGEFVFEQFHVNDHINRVFYEDYVQAMHQFQVVRWETMWNHLPPKHLSALRSRFPGYADFSTYGGLYKLAC
jgi:hypothetical protein